MDSNSKINETSFNKKLSIEDIDGVEHIKIEIMENSFILGSISKLSPKTAQIGILFINPSFQGLGLGPILLKEFIKYAKSKGVEKICGYSTNINAIKAAAKVIDPAKLMITKIETGKRVEFKDITHENYNVEVNI